MKCIVIDDEPLAREGMAMLVKEVPTLELLESFSGVMEAYAFLQKNQVDLIFLDIEMPRMTGLAFLKNLTNPPLVIFTTAYPQYALEGFELDVVDYLVKPIRFERFFKAVSKAQTMLKAQRDEKQGPASESEPAPDYVFVRADRKFVKLYFKDISVIEGLKDYSIIFTGTEKTITAMNLKTVESRLPSDIFVRVNKSYIINRHLIQQVENDVIYINDRQIPVGERYRQDFFDRVIKDNWIKR